MTQFKDPFEKELEQLFTDFRSREKAIQIYTDFVANANYRFLAQKLDNHPASNNMVFARILGYATAISVTRATT